MNKQSLHSIYGVIFDMISYFSEIRYKEVIDVHNGLRLGYVCDAEYDDSGGQLVSIITPGRGYVCDAEIDDGEGRIVSLITPGKSKFFGLFGREDDYILPWKCIVRMGPDIILVENAAEQPRRKREKRKFF